MTSAERHAYKAGRRCFERGDDQTALAHLSTLLRTRQEYADVHYMVGVLHERRRDEAAAAQSLLRALRINPNYTEARLALASIYEGQGDFDRSRELTESARAGGEARAGALDATTRGKLANLHAALGNAYREAGELREAVECYRKALDRCPGFHDIRLRLGQALREAGLPDQALREFRRIQGADASVLEAPVQAALTLYSLGRCDEAIREWEEVLRRDPRRSDALMYLRLVKPSSP